MDTYSISDLYNEVYLCAYRMDAFYMNEVYKYTYRIDFVCIRFNRERLLVCLQNGCISHFMWLIMCLQHDCIFHTKSAPNSVFGPYCVSSVKHTVCAVF